MPIHSPPYSFYFVDQGLLIAQADVSSSGGTATIVYNDYLAEGGTLPFAPTSVASGSFIVGLSFVATADFYGICAANSDCAQVGISPGALTTYLSVSVPVTAVDASIMRPEPSK